jgi:putative membrane protein
MRKKFMAFIIVFILVLSSTAPVYASSRQDRQKDENVYALLNSDGTLSEVYVVNTFSNLNGENFKDYGTYESVENLTGKDMLHLSQDYVWGSILSDSLAYKGKLKNPVLPWNFAISYQLNGQTLSSQELAGKSGDVEITIEVKNNHELNYFCSNYALQIQLTLDESTCSEIEAPYGVVANNGIAKDISFTSLPDTDTSFTVKTKANLFEMSEIIILAIPFNVQLPQDTQDGLSGMTKNIQELPEYVAKLNTGIKSLNEAVKNLDSALNGINAQSSTIQLGSSEALKAITELDKVAEAMGEAVPVEIRKAILLLKEQYGELDKGIQGYTGGIEQVAVGCGEISKGSSDLAFATNMFESKASELSGEFALQAGSLIDTLTNQDFSPVSFASKKNTDVFSVVFIMKTDKIKPQEKADILPEKPEKLNLWEKLLNLFHL